MRPLSRLVALAALLAPVSVNAAEPNETFATATVLAPGVLTVSDELIQAPDTLLGITDFFGNIVDFDDDGSPVGSTRASGLAGVETPNGVISFAISGFGDDGFVGNHNESGDYEVFVQTYNSFGNPETLYSNSGTLQPGSVEEYSFLAEEAVQGTYDVYIDNLGYFNVEADIDYFTFTGLIPGATFTAETFDPQSSGIDTQLAWFGDSGLFPIGEDDDGGVGGLSLLTGTVPANGKVTLAVTGTNDDAYEGDHLERGAYELKLTLGGGVDYAADFNNDGKVNGADLAAWKLAFGQGAEADANNDLKTDGADFLIWQRQFGSGVPTTAAAAAIPEPASAALLMLAFGGTAMSVLRQPPGRRSQTPSA